MITFLILPLSCHLHTSTSRLAPRSPRRLADHHLRPYPTYATTRPSTLPLLVSYPTSPYPTSSGCRLQRHLSLPIILAPAPALPALYPTTTPRQLWVPALALLIPTYHTRPSSSTTRPLSYQLWVPALAPPIPTYHTSPSSSTTRLYPTTTPRQPFPTDFIRLISPIRPIRLITPPIAPSPHAPEMRGGWGL